MKKISKILSVFLCVVILLGIAPAFDVSALAIEKSGFYVGQHVWFGQYSQSAAIEDEVIVSYVRSHTPDSDNVVHYNGAKYRIIDGEVHQLRPVEWRVLDITSDGVLMISEKILDKKFWNGTDTAAIYETVSYAESSIRKWLNTTFYQNAFTSKEREQINITYLSNNHGLNTLDRIFLLSRDEVFTYFEDANDRLAYFANASNQHENWWLRSSSATGSHCIYYVYGGIGDCPYHMQREIGVRPAIVIDLNTSVYQVKENTTYSITAVDGNTNKPLSGASIEYNNACYGYTGDDGTYVLDVGESANSASEITITKERYGSVTKKLYEFDPYSGNTVSLTEDFNISTKLSDIALSGETIYGPVVNVLGNEFPLFKFDAKLSIPLTGLSVSVKQDTVNHKVKAILGYKTGYDYDSDAKWNEDYADFKKYYQLLCGGSASSARSLYGKLRGKLKSVDGDIGFGTSMTFAGFLEYDYSSGEMVLVDGGLSVTAEANVSQDVPFAAICYATFKIGGEISGTFTMKNTSSGLLDVSTKLEFAVKPTIGVGAKLISKNVASVEAGIDGKIAASVTIPSASFSKAFNAYLEAQAYVKVKALWIYENKWSTNFPHLELYPNFGSLVTASLDEDDLELIDRSYRDNMHTQVLGDINEESVYPYGNPELVTLSDGRILAVYVYDDGKKSDINRTTLYYSIYDGDTWSVPEAVFEAEGADFKAELCALGDTVYAVYQRTVEALPDDSAVDTVKENTELVLTSFDGESWSTPEVVSGKGKYQLSYGVAAKEGEVSVAWGENSENDYTLLSGTTTVYTVTKTADSFGEKTAVYSSLGINSIDVGYIDGGLKVACTVDGDGDFNTAGDNELYINGVALTSDELDDCDVSFQNGAFYWNKEGMLYTYDGELKSSGVSVGEDIRVIENGNTSAVTSLFSDGFKNELYISYLKDGEYTSPVAVTSLNKHISSYDVLLNEKGETVLLADVDNLSNDENAYPYTTTDMVCTTVSKVSKAELSNVYFTGNATRGGTVTVNYTVKNSGTEEIASPKAVLLNKNGEVLRTENLKKSLLPGEEYTGSFDYTLSDTFTKQTLSLSFETDEEAFGKESFEIGLADISVFGESIDRDGKITASVVNNGCDTAKGVSVEIKGVSADNKTLTTLNAGDIAPGESKTVTYNVPTEYLSFSSYYVVNKFKLTAVTESEEENDCNNDADVVYAPVAVTGISLSASTLSLIKGEKTSLTAAVFPSDAYNKGVHWVTDATNIVTVDQEGNITAVAGGTAIITAITDDGGFVSQCEVTVTVPAKGVSLVNGDTAATVGQTVEFECSFDPSDATNKDVVWGSSLPEVAKIDENGVATALKTGETVISVTSNDGGYTASAILTVTNPVRGVTLNEQTVSMCVGDEFTLKHTVTPSDADNTDVVYSSNALDVAKVSENGVVTAINTGTAVITVRTVDGDFTATCTVNVTKRATGIIISESEINLYTCFTRSLTATVLPLAATNRNVSWASSNEKVATVDSYGNVTAVGTGKAMIIAESEDGGFNDICIVNVTAPKITAVSTVTIDSENKLVYNMPQRTKSLEGYVEAENDSFKVVAVGEFYYLGTNTALNVLSGTTICDTYSVVVFGDLNGDGVVDVLDVAISERISSGHFAFDDTNDPTGAYRLAADANCDGETDVNDLSVIVNTALRA